LDDVKKKPSDEKKKKAGRPKKTTHSSGMYRKRITLGHDSETGKPIVKAVYGKTQDELKDKIAKLRVDRGMGVAITDDKSTWKYWAKTWKDIAYAPMGKSTKDMYNSALVHLSPLNDKRVSKLTPTDLNVITTNMYTNGYSKRTIKSVISTARQICKLARKNHAMIQDIAEDINPDKSAPVKEITAITPEEEELIWNIKPLMVNNKADKARAERLPLIRMFALMQLNCGPRKEECAALEWKNVDLKKGILSIDSAYCYAEKDLKGPKSKAGYRDIPIPKRYLSELKAWKKANSGSALGRKYVFPGNSGIISDGQFKRLWNILIDAINGITVSKRISVSRKKKGPKEEIILNHQFKSHQLRHTYATNCIAAGIDVRTVQYLMGHAKPDMTMHYTHFSQSSWDEAREKLDNEVSKELNNAVN